MPFIPFGPWNTAPPTLSPPPNPMHAYPGSSGLGWKADKIVSQRDMPKVTRADYAAIPGSWTAVLEVYRIHRRCGVKSRDARRELLVMLEPWAWAIEKAARNEKPKRGGGSNAGSGGKPSSNRRN